MKHPFNTTNHKDAHMTTITTGTFLHYTQTRGPLSDEQAQAQLLQYQREFPFFQFGYVDPLAIHVFVLDTNEPATLYWGSPPPLPTLVLFGTMGAGANGERDAVWQAYAREGNEIRAYKEVRALYSLSLSEARDVVANYLLSLRRADVMT
jgi:hypothetical protein